MSSVLQDPIIVESQMVRVVKDPRPIAPPGRPVRDEFEPETIERQASEFAAGAFSGAEGFAKAASLLVAYRQLHRRYQTILAQRDRYHRLASGQVEPADELPAPMTSSRLARLVRE